MESITSVEHRARDLYWLAFLLTGNREVSVDAAVDALRLDEGTNPFFSKWMAAWERKVVISKALATIRADLAESSRRTELSRHGNEFALPGNKVLRANANKEDIEAALLAIDSLPRCAVVLVIFERLSEDDATVLLDCDRRLLRKAQAIGLRELTHALATAPRDRSGLVAQPA